MTFKRTMRDAWRAGRIGAAFAVLLGLAALLLRTPLERWSFDWPHALQPETRITNVAIVFMDDISHTRLHQPYDGPWDRRIHAELVEVLTQAGARAIAFDDLFTDEGTNAAASEALARAIHEHPRVVLGADLGSGDYFGLSAETKVILPHTNFLAATPYWGFVQIKPDTDDAVREHFHGWEDVPSLSWELAKLVGAETTKEPKSQRKERWMNYYGPRGTIPGLSLYRAIDRSDPAVREFFRDRVVFVGSATQSGFSGKRRDQFKTPYSGGSEPLWPGVEFHAIQFLNLVRGDWLRRLPASSEMALVIVCGLVAGIALPRLRPVAATATAIGSAVLVAAGASILMWHAHTWFAWLVIAAVQIPIALAWPVLRTAQQRFVARELDVTEQAPAVALSMSIPDHEMLRCIGSGGYGEVWLARSVTGTFRAVKVVDRKRANDPRFEREFAGLKKFEPISRMHEGLMNILHVGRNEASGQLYYVMELADSCASDPANDADGYVPKTLKSRLKSRELLNSRECSRLCLALTSALAFLHEQGLIHRDIKPSNIIFVQGQPKLADIGLVAGSDETSSFVGTEGFIPPEGPGTPAADVYSLGKVLMEVLARTEWAPSDKMLQHLRTIIEQACSPNLLERHRTGQQLLEKMRLALSMDVAGERAKAG